MARTTIALFSRDLRVRDNPALMAAYSAGDRVVPLFVLDEGMVGGRHTAPARIAYIVDALGDLRASLRERHGDLVVRCGGLVREVMRVVREVDACAVHCADDVSGHAGSIRDALARACEEARVEWAVHSGVTVVDPGAVMPVGGDHYKVFTPYWRAWEAAPRRPIPPTPGYVRLPEGIDPGPIPTAAELLGAQPPSCLVTGGETAARRRLEHWLGSGLAEYDTRADDLAADGTSRLSADLRFGCVSPREVAERAGDGAFTRQLAWRDFYHQVTAAFPAITRRDYRPRQADWNNDPDAFDAWREGRTGIPIVDAGMRQLRAEGFMHNRARMIVASVLCKRLRVDWRYGAAHFMDLLVDGDVANNYGNWQWCAGTGNDTRPNRVLNPLRQARRFDPSGDYVRKYVSELAGLDAPLVHRPWTAPAPVRRGLAYPPPLLDPDTMP
jgi:deoxyribodipyrimidine photo-lyase